MTMSILGHYNNFFFAAHLLDIAMGFKTLRTILSSVTHNGKQVNRSKAIDIFLLLFIYFPQQMVATLFWRYGTSDQIIILRP